LLKSVQRFSIESFKEKVNGVVKKYLNDKKDQ